MPMLQPSGAQLDVVPCCIFGALLLIATVSLTSSLNSLLHKIRSHRKPSHHNPERSTPSIDDLLILPGQTSHTRLFPKCHKFTYSYLMVGIPIHSSDQGNRLLSVDECSWWKRGWLRVEAKDHLERGGNENGIRRKLELYLDSQGVDAAEYPKIYLITSPRFMNYKFSPASFWYLFSADHELKAMISEVNNTFDERRMYFHPFNMSDQEKSRPREHFSLERHPSYLHRPPQTFKHVWSKDFHVSPFNSRKGTYSLSARGPPLPSMLNMAKKVPSEAFVDIKATLMSSDGRPKLATRLWSTSKPLEPKTLSPLGALMFVCSWWWVGLITYPRILVEATRLAFLRKLSIWYRPEVKPTTVARKATVEEIVISHIFGEYLVHLVNRLETRVQVRCSSIDNHPRQWTFEVGDSYPLSGSLIDLTVLTPAFYSRLVAYRSLQSAFDAEVLATDFAENQTAQISDKGTFCTSLLDESPSDTNPQVKTQHQHQPESMIDIIAWRLVYLLRRPPTPGLYPSPALPSERAKVAQGRTRGLSEPSTTTSTEIEQGPNHLDTFVRCSCGHDEQREYRRALLRLFLANSVAMGSLELLRYYRLMTRVLGAGLVLALLRGGASEPTFERWLWPGLITVFLWICYGRLEGEFL